MSTPSKVRKIKASKYKSREFAALLLYLPEKNNAGQLIYASLTCKIHLIKDLGAILLIENDIISLKSLVIVVKETNVVIGSCEVIVPIDVKNKKQFLTRKILERQETMISPYSKAMVLLFSLSLSDNRDFLFYLATQVNLTLFIHIVDHQTSKVFVKITFNESLCILCRYKLGYLIDIVYDNCFFTNIQSVFDALISPLLSYQPSSRNNNFLFLLIDPFLKKVLDNKVKVYRHMAAVK